MAKKKAPLTPDGDPESLPAPDPCRTADSDDLPRGKTPKPPAKRAPPRKVGGPGAERPEPSALDRAQALADRALELTDPKGRAALAREALKLSPDCSDAYLLLAEQARGRREAIEMNQLAVDAATRVLGGGRLDDSVGHFWAIPETRPYMRARANLAETLWAAGNRAEAADHIRDLLRLNPSDNQGLRHILAGWLLNLDAMEELDALLDRYDEESTTWTYTKALVAFRRSGDTLASRKSLQAARRSNRHVPEFLLGRQPLPVGQPTAYRPGDADDAILYVASQLGAWKSSSGALTWLRSKVKDPKKARRKARPSSGASVTSKARLLRLPIESDSWQADYRQFTRRIEVAGERVRPWMILVASKSRDLVLAHALTEELPTPETLWDLVAEAMENPPVGDPHRPSELVVRPASGWDSLAGPFDEIGVACELSEILEQIDFLFDDLTRHMENAEPPGLLDMPGVTVEQVGKFYEAAARFYLRAPWRSLGFESVIKVECDRYESGPWYAVIMGQSGLTLGVALYEDLALLRKMWAGKLSDEEGAKRTVALTVTYDDDASMPEVDIESIDRHGFALAAPEAYPSAFRKDRGLSMRPPLSWELDLLSACLATLPGFVDRRDPSDTTREAVVVEVGSSPMELGLSWVEEPV